MPVRASVYVAAVLATGGIWGCSLVSGLDQLDKVQCVGTCDAGDATGSGVDSGETGDASGADGASGSAYRAAVVADNPVGYWRLGDPAGSTTCHAVPGYGTDGTVIGGVTFGVPGALKGDPNTAAQFDGVTGTIDLGNAFTFAGAAPFSWELWVKPTVLDKNFRPFLSSMVFDNDGNPVSGSYMIAYSDTHVPADTFGFERYNASNDVIALDTGGLQVNVWTYIVATSDASGNGVVYMNGVAVLTSTNAGSVPTYIADTILGQLLVGELDEMAIYDHALSAQSVLNHWNAATE
jgi:Concanavalin A-like lectin/glucanases superfamily